jgi:uncharacterized phage protein (TIGR01671 family)
MREILFRGKTLNGNELVIGAGVYKSEGYTWIITDDVTKTENRGTGSDAIILETIGQFTGLTDKNGKKIFEGDIGRYKQTDGAKRNGKPIICTGFVIYNAKTASYAVESKDEVGCEYFDYFPIKDFEVIGNIHDNQELSAEE